MGYGGSWTRSDVFTEGWAANTWMIGDVLSNRPTWKLYREEWAEEVWKDSSKHH